MQHWRGNWCSNRPYAWTEYDFYTCTINRTCICSRIRFHIGTYAQDNALETRSKSNSNWRYCQHFCNGAYREPFGFHDTRLYDGNVNRCTILARIRDSTAGRICSIISSDVLGDEARAEEERVNRRAKQTSSPPLT